MSYRLLIFLILSVSLKAQYSIKHYSTIEGIPHDLCYGILQDSKGYIWLGTDDGLLKYDGTYFTTFGFRDGLESNYVIDVYQDAKDHIYVATWGAGLHVLKNNRFVKIGAKNKLSKIVVNNDMFISKATGDHFYFLGKDLELVRGFSKVANKQYYKAVEGGKGYDVTNFDFEKVNGKVYFFSAFEKNNRGVFFLDKYNNLRSGYNFLENQLVRSIGNYDTKLMYVVTDENLILFNKEKIVKKIKLPYPQYLVKRAFLKNKKLLLQLFDKKTQLDQIALCDLKSNKSFFWKSTVFEDKLISDIIIDNENNFWVSTYGAGLFKIFEENFSLHEFYFPNENVLDVNEDLDNLYFISSSKIFSLNKKSKTIDSVIVPNQNWKSVKKESGEIYFVSKSKAEKKLIELHDKKMFVGEQEAQKFNYESTQFSCFDINFEVQKGEINKKYLFKSSIKDVVRYKKYLYFGTDDGLLVYDLSNLKFIKRYTVKNGLPNNMVRDLAIQGNKIWVATSNGLAFVESNILKKVYTEELLPSNSINSIGLDNYGVLWVGTQKGLSLYENGEFYSFQFSNPKISSHIFKVFIDKKGHVWIAGNKGVFKINNVSSFKPRKMPRLEVEKKGKRIKFQSISFSENKKIVQVKLNTENWKTTNDTDFDFSRYQFGKYKVRFRSRNSDTNWNYSDYFVINNKAPWYKEWWGYTIIALVFAIISSLLFYLRFNHVKKRNEFLRQTILENESLQKELSEVRENVAQDFHDELGNKLAGITVLSALMKEKESDKESKQYQQISRIQRDAEDLYYGIKDFIWSIDSKNDDLRELIFYLKDFGEELFAFQKTSFTVINTIDNVDFRLPYYWSRQILLLFKEAMTNAVKYAEAEKCVLKFEITNNQLIISLCDDGIGFDENQLKRVNGLNNMKKRAMKINGVLLINSTKGTLIKLICPSFIK